ncbi:MAG TPA: AraC family transcriptional regulator [Aquabacterium sp.]|nr:AraC family transcriptional regulator [Aquabacterium sp.]
MRYWDFKRGPASVRLLVEFGQEQGLDVARLLARSRLKEADLDDPAIELDASQELCVVGNLLRACRQPGLGLEVGMRYNFASYGLWGLGLISSATAGDALALALRFIPLTFAFCRISGDLDGEVYSVTFEAPDVEPAVQRFLVERDVAAASRLMKETLGPRFALSRFTIQHHAERGAGSIAELVRMAGVHPEFGASRNSLSFDRKLLELRLPQANPVTVAMCERACEELMERRRARLGTGECLRQYLAAAPIHTAPDLPQAARALGLSDRTLKRRLQDEGVSYRMLLAEVRGRQANQLLEDDTLSLSQIAERMGFSDLSSFSQAYKRWFGVAPSVGRMSVRGGAA